MSHHNHDSHCSGCKVPFSHSVNTPKTVQFDGRTYHENCKPSGHDAKDREYWKGCYEGYVYSRERRELSPELAEAREVARDMQREGYRADMPQERREAKPPRDVSKMSVEALRQEFKLIQGRSHAPSKKAFLAACRELLGRKGITEPTPQQWVKAARGVTFKCRRCAGSGRFTTGMLNGKPTGPGGMCFRCQGKGVRNDADERRNYGYDVYYVNRSAV